ncbi:phosphatidylinositol transfer protein csr1 [Coemansia sp. RSA 2523]|nr:phosphatidylinositol transfer protein csr1 [Coemansia sp. RSA 1824]KAJ1791239.1 phosphatidylinositol transfer protein csr1 [Coemansia sp. RSA 2167]KAJ1806856.1 phosphatidylinositol transfer protein csr1 [Coemansia sp. RSA 2523]KAJ2153260.1 phosphatidylinositol transfer protein csr1 [Coemansia sp. RSA 637]KAJ2229386.1 phosphatidylinositol transfer protein csr1 [Coemansia sp. RSA 518]KAJ2405277.1 phosphatidylinositol transfer protein csr1 [Coemansia sp. RSA 2526]KAJ2536157.1 phosphatidylinos
MSGLFKAISRQRSQVDMAGSGREPILAQYSKGRLDKSGVYDNLSPIEENLLADLWERFLDALDTPLAAVPSDAIVRPIEYDEEADRKRAQHTQDTAPFEVFEGCMFNETVADKCTQLGIVSEAGADGELVPPYESQISDETLGSALWAVVREDHPDVLLLRFLRARKWDVDKAFKMAVAAIKWRVHERVEEIIWYGDTHNDASLMWKGVSYAHGKDRLGQPIVWSGSCLHHQKDQSYPQLKRYLIWMMETLRTLLVTPVERVCLIMDLSDHSNANMDWPFVKTFIKFLEAYYPECLGLCVVYNGPWWFSGVWKLISPLLDPVVASKVQFASKPDALLKFIDPQELLESRGGLDKYAYEYVKPQAEENKLMFDTEGRQAASTALDKVREQFVQATREWTDAKEGGDDDAFARASRERKELSDKYRLAAKEKDKYTRARHFYTRTGVLADGKVDWSKVQRHKE